MGSDDELRRCLGCGYDLRGLPEHRCPECGRAFDPADPSTYAGRPKCGAPYLIVALIAVASPFAAVGLGVLFLRNSLWNYGGTIAGVFCFAALALLIGGLWLGAWNVKRCWQALELPPGAMCHRACCKVALIISFPFGLLAYLPPELTLVLAVALALALLRFLSSC